MKKLLLSAGVLLLATGAFAQTTMSGNTARFGLKAGVNLSSYSGTGVLDRDYKSNVGYNVTAFGDFGVGNNFFIQPGVSLQNKGAKLESTSTVGGSTVTGTFKQDVMAIEVPVNAVVRIPTGDAGAFQISAGPYVGFNISGKNKYSGTYTNAAVAGSTFTDRDIEFGSTTSDDLSSIDFGANFGLAYRLNSGVSIGANYGLGISNLVPKDLRSNDDKLRNRVIGFTIGYSL
ncbi:porin family protein [Pedobacter aquatilis]|uniref:porin family protein n=1 Tax=Pedobacter aquatilis TaxID=351343 RepID=UPI0025B53487|nr:porin family protein [Pedobacter aquatilis]MDN3587158.1 porin family protein [Pedobacter aquatilis]